MDAINNPVVQNMQSIKPNAPQNNEHEPENKVEMKKDGNKKLAAALVGLAALGTAGIAIYKVAHGKPVNVGIEDLKKAGVGYTEANKMMKNAQGLITDKEGNVIKDLVINAKRGNANIKIKDGQIIESTIAGTGKTPGCIKKFSLNLDEKGKTIKTVEIFDESGKNIQKSIKTRSYSRDMTDYSTTMFKEYSQKGIEKETSSFYVTKEPKRTVIEFFDSDLDPKKTITDSIIDFSESQSIADKELTGKIRRTIDTIDKDGFVTETIEKIIEK